MRDRLLILVALLALVGALAFPIWHAALAKTTAGGPELQRPAGQEQCIEARDTMRRSHMQLLLRWRDDAGLGIPCPWKSAAPHLSKIPRSPAWFEGSLAGWCRLGPRPPRSGRDH